MTDEELRELVESTAIMKKENELARQKSYEESLELRDEMRRALEHLTKTVDTYIGISGQRIGRLAEQVFLPGIRPILKAKGHDYEHIVSDMLVKDSKNHDVAEVDMFMHNDEEAMAIEVKTYLTEEKVLRHLERLEKLRKFEESANVKGKKLYGGIAAIMMVFSAKKLALDNGLYAITILEDDKKLEIREPKDGALRVF